MCKTHAKGHVQNAENAKEVEESEVPGAPAPGETDTAMNRALTYAHRKIKISTCDDDDGGDGDYDARDDDDDDGDDDDGDDNDDDASDDDEGADVETEAGSCSLRNPLSQ